MMEASHLSETMVLTRATLLHILEDGFGFIHRQGYENHKSYMGLNGWTQ
jgi:hypothetical protein